MRKSLRQRKTQKRKTQKRKTQKKPVRKSNNKVGGGVVPAMTVIPPVLALAAYVIYRYIKKNSALKEQQLRAEIIAYLRNLGRKGGVARHVPEAQIVLDEDDWTAANVRLSELVRDAQTNHPDFYGWFDYTTLQPKIRAMLE